MKIENQGSEFKVQYDNTEYDVPAGFFEVEEVGLAAHIIAKGKQWGYKVIKLGETKAAAIKKIVSTPEPEVEDKKEEKKEEKKAEKKEEKVEKKETKKDTKKK